MYSRTQVSSASASWRVNSGVTARDLAVATVSIYEAPPSTGEDGALGCNYRGC